MDRSIDLLDGQGIPMQKDVLPVCMTSYAEPSTTRTPAIYR